MLIFDSFVFRFRFRIFFIQSKLFQSFFVKLRLSSIWVFLHKSYVSLTTVGIPTFVFFLLSGIIFWDIILGWYYYIFGWKFIMIINFSHLKKKWIFIPKYRNIIPKYHPGQHKKDFWLQKSQKLANILPKITLSYWTLFWFLLYLLFRAWPFFW